MEYKINTFLTLKLEEDCTNIYVNDVFFRQCKYLLIDIPRYNLERYEEINSIDEVIEILDHSLERGGEISPETEFWGHCSNMQVWAENNYDTSFLNRNLAFPLLKKLTEVGDSIAKKVFKEEIAKRFKMGSYWTQQFLIVEDFISNLN